jgi:hypothetical protein
MSVYIFFIHSNSLFIFMASSGMSLVISIFAGMNVGSPWRQEFGWQNGLRFERQIWTTVVSYRSYSQNERLGKCRKHTVTCTGFVTNSDHQMWRVGVLETPFGLLLRFIYDFTSHHYNHFYNVTRTRLTASALPCWFFLGWLVLGLLASWLLL